MTTRHSHVSLGSQACKRGQPHLAQKSTHLNARTQTIDIVGCSPISSRHPHRLLHLSNSVAAQGAVPMPDPDPPFCTTLDPLSTLIRPPFLALHSLFLRFHEALPVPVLTIHLPLMHAYFIAAGHGRGASPGGVRSTCESLRVLFWFYSVRRRLVLVLCAPEAPRGDGMQKHHLGIDPHRAGFFG
ncbi:hypothetical protein F5148DRAFT_389801 [Russula earlei]|uniref:Uncharacterized protein n=1 Tax=Russula earlei TaxID=71964 RepID=A0ACC0UJC5_9AGAM|nr:hypothetical protein F5148DRAFT_389801 [Russula earlei]